MRSFKVVLLGEGGVGKSTWVKRHLTGDFEKRYKATLGVEVHPLKFNTNYGNICLNVWDCAGQEKFGGLRDGYYIQGNACIVMFDLTSLRTFKNATKWIYDFIRVAGADKPIVLCGSKHDLKHDLGTRNVPNELISDLVQKTRISYFEISSKTNYNFDEPFLEISKRLMGKADLQFVP